MKSFILSTFLAGCGSNEAVKINHASLSTTNLQAKNSVTNYHQILDNLGLGPVFSYGRVRRTDGSITVPLTPKDINQDTKYTGKITKEEQLLSKLGTRIAQAISLETGISPNKVETIVYEIRCEVRLSNERAPVEDCDRAFPFKYSTAKNMSVELLRSIFSANDIDDLRTKQKIRQRESRIRESLDQNKARLDGIRTAKDIVTVNNFCRKFLNEKLKKYDFQSPDKCNPKPIPGKSNTRFVISGIETKGFISNESFEKFNIEFSNSPFLSSDDLKVKISSVSISKTPDDEKRPNSYLKIPLDDDGNKRYILDAEDKLSMWLDNFKAEQQNK